MHDGHLEQFSVTSFKNTFYVSGYFFCIGGDLSSLFPDLTYNLNYW